MNDPSEEHPGSSGLYHQRCWTEKRTNGRAGCTPIVGPALGPDGDSLASCVPYLFLYLM